jgi:hypothetical protein
MKASSIRRKEPAFTTAWTRWEHRSPVAKVYKSITESQVEFVVSSLKSPRSGECEILYIERNNSAKPDFA